MSTAIMAICWPLQMPPTPKAVLISLADNANDHGDCYPSIPTICERTCLGRTAVIDAIKWLEQHDALVANRENGRHTTYRLTPKSYRNPSATRTGEAPANQSAKRTRPPRVPVRQPDDTSPPGGRDQSARRTLTVKEPSRNRQKENAPARPGDVAEQVWSDWLRHRRSKRAEVTGTALAGIEREALKAGWSLQDALAESCARGWTGFKAEWVADRRPLPRGSPAGPTSEERQAAKLARLTGGLWGSQPEQPRTIDVEAAEPVERTAPRLAAAGR